MIAVLKNPRWGRSKTSHVKKRERLLTEKARSEGPLRRAPILMSGSIDLRLPPDPDDHLQDKVRLMMDDRCYRPLFGRLLLEPSVAVVVNALAADVVTGVDFRRYCCIK